MIYGILTLFWLIEFNVNAQVVITDITSSNLIGDAYNDGKYGGHGVMFADADGDGDPDMYITMNNSAPMVDLFFENTGNGVFVEKATERGIHNFDNFGSHGWVWADLDNDGDFDGWNGSYTENIPYKNRNNQPGYFDDFFITSGIHDVDHGTRGMAAFDFDRDGDLDLFGNNFTAYGALEENEFYRNNGDLTFTRIDNGLTYAKGDQGVCDGDFDNDGDIDMILSVFSDPGNPERCVEIWENNNGQFIKVLNTGLNLCGTVDGVTLWDMNNDGWLDVVSGYKIFLNNGNKTFTEIQNVPPGTRFMRGIADLNNDGYWDLISPGLNQVFINNGDLTFTAVNYSTGTIADPRSISCADVDGDGDVDFVLGQKEYYNRLYRNDYSENNKYLFVKLRTANNQIGAFGAKVYIYSETGDTLLSYRQAKSNQGYLSQDDPVLHFGCGIRDFVKVRVVFLNNHVYEFITSTNQRVEIIDQFVLLSTKIFLEGPYITTSDAMSRILKTSNLIPPTSPYSQDPRTVGSVPTGVVDWVLVELRGSATGSTVVSRSAFLMSDGTIVADDGVTNQIELNASPESYYVVLKHRNHLSVMSNSAVSFSSPPNVTSYDFTTGSNKFYGSNGAKELEQNVWGMIAGDANDNGEVQNNDGENYWKLENGTGGYKNSDFNLNGQVQNNDYENYWKPNNGRGSQVPNP